MSDPSNICQVPECRAKLRHGYLMCGWHWHSTPEDLRTAVNRTWAILRKATVDERPAALTAYEAACKEAIAGCLQNIRRTP